MLNEYSAEQIAAALLRIHNKQKPAPEELLDFTDAKSDKKKKKHSNFTNSTWVSLSVGREERAEPRWIIPMLCGAGQMANGQIGSIRIHNKETYVELSTECADKLFTLVGEGGTLEKNITVTRLDEEPEAPKGKIDRSRRPNRKSGKKSYENDKARGDKSKSSFKKKRKSYNDDTPQNNTSGDTRSRREKPNDDGFKKKYKSKSDDGFKGKKSKKPFKGEGNKGSSTHPAEKRKAFKNKKKKD